MSEPTLSYNNAICRACLGAKQGMIYLFSPFDGSLTLSEMLEFNTTLQIKNNDGLPEWICKQCSDMIVTFYDFLKCFKKSQKHLSNIMKQHILQENRIEQIKYENAYSETEEISRDRYLNKVNTDTDIEHFSENTDIDSTHEANTCNVEEVSENIAVDSVKYSCEECGDCFLFKTGFQQHMNKKHKMEITDFEKYCSKITIKVVPIEDDLQPIILVKSDLQCKICKEVFDSRSALEEHVKTHKNHTCEHCGATFKKKSYFVDHLEVHSTERHHICKICGKSYRRRSGLRYHKKMHANLRNLVCEICGRRFNDKGNLRTHIKLKHTAEKNFQCTFCGLSFALNPWLRKHMLRKHAGERERNYICNICGIAYFEKGTLSRHMSVKHSNNGKKYSCTSCGKDYTTKTNLNKHYRSVHLLSKSNSDDLSV